jgi:FtsZ-binding cell division protein ZapB
MEDGADIEALRAENAALRRELDDLQQEVEEMQQELDDLRYEADLDACHAAGLRAQIQALIAEGDACPNKDAHPLLERASYVHSRTGEQLLKTRAFPIYREAFDAEAAELGIADPGRHRS